MIYKTIIINKLLIFLKNAKINCVKYILLIIIIKKIYC